MKKHIFILIFLFFISKSVLAQSDDTLEQYIRDFRYNETIEYISGKEATPYLLFHKGFMI